MTSNTLEPKPKRMGWKKSESVSFHILLNDWHNVSEGSAEYERIKKIINKTQNLYEKTYGKSPPSKRKKPKTNRQFIEDMKYFKSLGILEEKKFLNTEFKRAKIRLSQKRTKYRIDLAKFVIFYLRKIKKVKEKDIVFFEKVLSKGFIRETLRGFYIIPLDFNLFTQKIINSLWLMVHSNLLFNELNTKYNLEYKPREIVKTVFEYYNKYSPNLYNLCDDETKIITDLFSFDQLSLESRIYRD